MAVVDSKNLNARLVVGEIKSVFEVTGIHKNSILTKVDINIVVARDLLISL
jgi:hypothetical protein